MTPSSPQVFAPSTPRWWEVHLVINRNWLVAVSGVLFGWSLDQFGMRVEGGAIAVLGFAPLYFSIERRLFPGFFFGPLTFMYLYHAMGYGIGPLGQMFLLEALTFDEQGFVPAQWGGVLGLAVFAIMFPRIFQGSLQAIQRRWSRPFRGKQDSSDWHDYTIFIMLTGIAVIAYDLVSGAASRMRGEGGISIESSSLLAAFQAVHQVMFFFLAYLAAKRRGRWWFFWLVMLFGYSTYFFLEGGRGNAVFAAVLSAMGFAWAGTSWRKLVLLGAVAAIVYVPISGMVLTYRSYFRDQVVREDFRNRAIGFLSAVEVTLDQSDGGFETISKGFLAGITAMSVDQVFLQTPSSIPFAGLEGIENALWIVVPTIINPDRPKLDDGNTLAIKYDQTKREDAKGWYMPAVGDGYRRGGWTGIGLLYIFSALIFGPVLAMCWARLANAVWMSMFVWLSFFASGIWAISMLTDVWLLWACPRQWVTFWGLHKLQKSLWAMGQGLTGQSGMLRYSPPSASVVWLRKHWRR